MRGMDKTQRIQAILTGETLRKAMRSAGPRPPARDPDADLQDVTEEDLQAYVATHGFPPGYVSDEAGLLRDGLKIDAISPSYYETYSRERGRKSNVETFATLAEAQANAIQRILRATRLWLERSAERTRADAEMLAQLRASVEDHEAGRSISIEEYQENVLAKRFARDNQNETARATQEQGQQP